MNTNLKDVASVDELRQRVLGLYGLENEAKAQRLAQLKIHDSDIRFSPGLEDFMDYVLTHRQDLLARIWWRNEWERYGVFKDETAKTLIYTLPDDSIILFVLDPRNSLAMDTQRRYAPSGLRRAAPTDLEMIGMAPYGCHAFPPSGSSRMWKVVVDDTPYMTSSHPIYLAKPLMQVGIFHVDKNDYLRIMQERFPDRIMEERIRVPR